MHPEHYAEDVSVQRRERLTIALVSTAHGSSHVFHLLLPPLFPWLMQDFGLSFIQVSLPLSLFYLISGFGQMLAGFAVDRFGAARVLLFGETCLALAALALALSPGYGGLFLVAMLAGAGNAVYHPAGFTILNRRLSEKRLGHAFAMHGLAGNLGWALSPALLTSVALWLNWRIAALCVGAIALLILAVLIWQRALLTVEDDKPATDKSAPSTLSFLSVPAVWLCFAFFFCMSMGFGTFQSLGAMVLNAVYGLSLAAAASTISLFLLSSACGVIAGGFLASKGQTHDRYIAIILVLAALLALLLASAVLPAAAVPAVMALIGFGSGLANPSRDMLVRRAAVARFGQQAFGRIYGLVYSGLDAGMALAPLVFGLFMDHGHFTWVLLGVACMQSLAVLTALKVGSPQPRTRAALYRSS